MFTASPQLQEESSAQNGLEPSSGSMLLYATETIRDGNPRTTVSIFTQLLSYERDRVELNVALLSTETVGTTRDGEPKAATSTFTQILGSESAPVQVYFCFTSTETIRTIAVLGTGSNPGLCQCFPSGSLTTKPGRLHETKLVSSRYVFHCPTVRPIKMT